MGSGLTKAAATLLDAKTYEAQERQAVKDQMENELRILEELAKMKTDAWSNSQLTDASTMPISKQIRRKAGTRALVKSSPESIKKGIDKVMDKGGVQGSWGEIVGGILKTAVTAFLDEASAGSDETMDYTCYCDGPTLVRLDWYLYFHEAHVEVLKKDDFCVCSYVFVQSAIDIGQCKPEDICAIISTTVTDQDAQAKAIDDITEAYSKAKSLIDAANA